MSVCVCVCVCVCECVSVSVCVCEYSRCNVVYNYIHKLCLCVL